jgi:hypothetical protein
VSIKGEDNVNCELAEEIGANIHTSIDNKPITLAKIKRQDHLQPLDSLFNIVKINEKSVYMNPTLLLTRLVAIAQREDDLADYFNYELTTTCMSLF